MTRTFEAMISTTLRRKFPDPLQRYDVIVDMSRKRDTEFTLPRFTIFRLTLASLKSK
jgi:hypothetical protein